MILYVLFDLFFFIAFYNLDYITLHDSSEYGNGWVEIWASLEQRLREGEASHQDQLEIAKSQLIEKEI